MKFKVTWKIIIYAIVLVLSALPAVLVNTLVGYIPILLVFLCGFLAMVWVLVLKNKVLVEVGAENLSCVRGEESPFAVHVRNQSILPVVGLKMVFFIADDDGNDTKLLDTAISLMPKEKRDFGFDAGFSHIGAYRAGIRKLELICPFGIFKAVNSDEKSHALEILPQAVMLNDLPVSTESYIETTKSRIQSPINGSEYTSVRDYAFGDPIKNIHWKLSAHAGSLMTKQMESYSNTGVSIILDMSVPETDGEERLDELDAVIEAGVASGDYAARNGLDYDLMFYRKDGTTARYVPASFRTLSGIVKEFHISVPSENNGARELLEEYMRNPYSLANVVICTTHIDHSLATVIATVKQSGHNPIVFMVVSKNLTERDRDNRLSGLKELQYYNIACQVISSAKEMEV